MSARRKSTRGENLPVNDSRPFESYIGALILGRLSTRAYWRLANAPAKRRFLCERPVRLSFFTRCGLSKLIFRTKQGEVVTLPCKIDRNGRTIEATNEILMLVV